MHRQTYISDISIIALLTLALSLSVFSGLFGSDEVTYTYRALLLTEGDWSMSSYIGGTRLGMNIPVAFFMWLFGDNLYAANLWPLLTSVGEVVLVYILGRDLWGRKAGLFAATILALTPIHLNYAGSLMADAPLAFFITLSFALFYFAEKTQSIRLYILSGLSIGFVYWIKETVIIYSLVFALYPLISRQWKKQWLLVALAAILMVLLNCLVMLILTGDPLYLLNVVRIAVAKNNVDLERTRGILFYPHFLFLDIKHTWLLGYLALAGIASLLIRPGRMRGDDSGNQFMLLWVISLPLLFTFFVTPSPPYLLIPKQTNYMLIFIAPLALCSGYLLAKVSNKLAGTLLLFFVSGGFVLSTLEQQAIIVFVANSKAAIEFKRAHPKAIVYGSINAGRIAFLADKLEKGHGQLTIRYLNDLDKINCHYLCNLNTNRDVFIIVDSQTQEWVSSSPEIYSSIATMSKRCLIPQGILHPLGFALGYLVLDGIRQILSISHIKISVIDDVIKRYLLPTSAVVYKMNPSCKGEQLETTG